MLTHRFQANLTSGGLTHRTLALSITLSAMQRATLSRIQEAVAGSTALAGPRGGPASGDSDRMPISGQSSLTSRDPLPPAPAEVTPPLSPVHLSKLVACALPTVQPHAASLPSRTPVKSGSATAVPPVKCRAVPLVKCRAVPLAPGPPVPHAPVPPATRPRPAPSPAVTPIALPTATAHLRDDQEPLPSRSPEEQIAASHLLLLQVSPRYFSVGAPGAGGGAMCTGKRRRGVHASPCAESHCFDRPCCSLTR